MDLHLTPARASDAEREAVEAVLATARAPVPATARVVRAGASARMDRHLLLPALHALQRSVGWISEGAVNHLAERLSIAPAEIYGVVTFYALLSVTPRPPTVVHLCDDLACRVSGAREIVVELERDGTEGSDLGGWTWARSPCLGMCEQAPAALAQRTGGGDLARGHVSAATIRALGQGATPAAEAPSGAPQADDGDPDLRVLRRVGVVDPASLDDYRARGGYAALAKAIDLGPAGVIAELSKSRLAGRGGAAFPTAAKWEAVARQNDRPHYVIANADESEPGAFKDRVLMEQDPFAVVEALTIAGLSCGAERGYVYVRGEYPLATARLEHALAQARLAGLLATDAAGGVRFDIELRRGAGAYVCGEETALFNSLEGKRGEPRNKPPFPVQRGLFDRPTAINNIETLVHVLEVLRIGGEAYAAIGTEGSTGPRLLCVSGHVGRPGVYEVVPGTTLGDLIALAGGVREGRRLKAVLLGGAAGTFVGPEMLAARLTSEDARAGGYTLGSGVAMVFDETTDVVDLCLRIARFFRDESCGQCVPCRVGTVRQEEALHRLVAGRTIGSAADELALLEDIARVMRDASICGLGQTAASAISSAITRLGAFAL